MSELARAQYSRGLRAATLSGVLMRKLVPDRNLKTGQLHDITVEAVARPANLDTVLIEQARETIKPTHEASEDTEVYLVTSAELTSGTRNLGRCAALTIVSYHQREHPNSDQLIYSTQLMHAAFPHNSEIIRSGLSESQTTRVILDAFRRPKSTPQF